MTPAPQASTLLPYENDGVCRPGSGGFRVRRGESQEDDILKTKSVARPKAVFMAAWISGSSSVAPADPPPELVGASGMEAAMAGPNLMADWSFESMETRAFTLETPFRLAADPQAHSGKADAQATLARTGKRIYARVSTWKNTDYVSSIWIRGSGSGTLFVADNDLSRRLAAIIVRATAQWREVSLPWKSGSRTSVAVGFQDDASPEGAVCLDDFYTGLKDGRTIAFAAPAPFDPKPPTDSFGSRRARRTTGTVTARSFSMAFRSRRSAGLETRYPGRVSRPAATCSACATERPNRRPCGATS